MGIYVEPPGPADPLAPQASAMVFGSVTSPTALQQIVATATLPAGTYQVTVESHIEGTTAAADNDNEQLLVGASVVGTLIMSSTAGQISNSQTLNVAVPSGGATISVQAIALATSGANYRTSLIVTRIG